MARKNRSPEENERRAKIRELLSFLTLHPIKGEPCGITPTRLLHFSYLSILILTQLTTLIQSTLLSTFITVAASVSARSCIRNVYCIL